MKKDTQDLPLVLCGFSEEERNNIAKLQFASMLIEIVSRVATYYESCLSDLEINNLKNGLEKNFEEFDVALSSFQKDVLKIALQTQSKIQG